jgi:hypothetical protein
MGEVYPPLAAPKATRGKGGGGVEETHFPTSSYNAFTSWLAAVSSGSQVGPKGGA